MRKCANLLGRRLGRCLAVEVSPEETVGQFVQRHGQRGRCANAEAVTGVRRCAGVCDNDQEEGGSNGYRRCE